MTLHPDVMLDIRLSTICSQHRYDDDPTVAIDELVRVAGNRADILAKVAGLWAGYHGAEPHSQPLTDALRAIPGAEPWVGVGEYRRGIPNSGAEPLPPTPK